MLMLMFFYLHRLFPQHLPLILMFLLPSTKVNTPAPIILFPISYSMIVLIPLFTSLPYLCLLLYSEVLRGGNIGTNLEQDRDEEMIALVSRGTLGLYLEVSLGWLCGSI